MLLTRPSLMYGDNDRTYNDTSFAQGVSVAVGASFNGAAHAAIEKGADFWLK